MAELFIGLTAAYVVFQTVALLAVIILDIIEDRRHKKWVAARNERAKMPRLERLELELELEELKNVKN